MEIEEKPFRTILEEVVFEALNKRELYEVLSVAEPVDEEADRLLDLIDRNYERVGRQKRIADGVWQYQGELNDVVFGTECRIYFLVNVIKDVGRYEQIRHQISKPLGYDQKKNEIYLSYNVIGGDVDHREVADDFGHELKHMYQELQRRGQQTPRLFSRPDGKDVYEFVTSHINSASPAKRIIASLFYHSVRREQDAFLNGLYGELKKIDHPSAYSYPDTNFHLMFNDYENKFDTFRNPRNRDIFVNASREYEERFGLGFNHLLHFFGSRINRLRRKRDRVLRRYDIWYRGEQRISDAADIS